MSGPKGRAKARLLVGGAVLAAGGLGIAAGATVGADHAPPAAAVATATAAVSRRTLVDTTTVSGQLGYAGQSTLTARSAGTITGLAAEGSAVRAGETLYEIDNQPVTLMAGRMPAYRRLAEGTSGADVRQLEKGLRALGYTGFEVDRDYTAATAAAVRKWQRDLGVKQTGVVELGSVVFGAKSVRIGAHQVSVGDVVAPGTPVMVTTSRRQVVTVDLKVDQQPLVRTGARVRVTLPGGREVTGRISRISSVAKSGQDGSDEDGAGSSSATIKVEISLDSFAKAGVVDQAPVEVALTGERRNGVLTVPVAALVARPEGGYAVDVVQGGSRRRIPVRVGMFADGRVEISGSGLRAGMRVEVPS